MRRFLPVLLSMILLAACAANLAPSAQSGPTSRILATTAPLQPHPTLLSTMLSTARTTAVSALPTVLPATPSSTPQPLADTTAPVGRVLYRCTTGLCTQLLGSTTTHKVVTFPAGMTTPDQPLPFFHGYALSADGTQLVYAIDAPNEPWGNADIYMADSDQLSARKLLRVKGALNGVGDPEGFGVLGFTADMAQIIFEDQAQVFRVRLDGTHRQAITPVLGYGASTTHYFTLSPSSTRLMVTTFGGSPDVPIYTVANGDMVEYALERSLAPISFLDDEHLLAARLADPYSDDMGEFPNSQRPFVGYEEVTLPQGTSRPLSLDRVIDSLSSNISHEYVVVRHGGVGSHGREKASYLLYSFNSGHLTPITLIDALGEYAVALALTGTD